MSDMKLLHIWVRCPKCREKIEINQEVGEQGLWNFTSSCLKCKELLTLENWTGRMAPNCQVLVMDIRKIIVHTIFHRKGIMESFNKPGLYYKELEDGTMAFVDFRDTRGAKYDIYAFKNSSKANVPDFKDMVREGIDWLWFDPMRRGRQNKAEQQALDQMTKCIKARQESDKDES